MKKMIRVVSLILAALMCVTVLAACGPSNPGTTENKVSTLEEEKGKKLSIMIPGHNANDTTLWQNQVVKEFKEKYPDVKVEFVTADWSNWEEKLMAAYRSGAVREGHN